MKTGRYVLSLAITLLLPGCANVDILRLRPSPHAQTAPDAVQILAVEPARPYIAIALVSVSSANLNEHQLLGRLVRAAARLGGDAIILDAHSLSRDNRTLLVSAKVVAFSDSLAQRVGSR